MKTIEQVLYLMMIHSAENPTHGYNCACKDAFLRQGGEIVRKMDPQTRKEMPYLFRIMLDEARRADSSDYQGADHD